MRSTAIDRRTFLALAGAATLAPWRAAEAAQDALFLGARRNGVRFEAAVIDEAGRDRLVLPLEARGHSFAIDAQNRRAVAFARSPGRFAVAFSPDGTEEPVAIAPPADRHFFGHGVFTSDGKLMLATENDYEAGHGVIGVYDASGGYRRIGEFASGGVGPHEAVLMPDGRTLCIGNGGILTHPDYDGIKLNLATMKPALAYVDFESGTTVERVELAPEFHQLSIRHMVVDAAGDVWFGCQYQGEMSDDPPLVGRHRRGNEPELFGGPADVRRSMRNYIGSVAADGPGGVIATASPRGGVIVFWDAASGRCLGTSELADGCGIAPEATARVIATSGHGAIVEAGPAGQSTLVAPDGALSWDHHLRRL